MVPSTSISSTRTGLARRRTFAGNLSSRIGMSNSFLLPPLQNTSEQLQRPQIMDVQDAFQFACSVHNQQRGDLFFFHHAQSAGGEFAARQRDGIRSEEHTSELQS